MANMSLKKVPMPEQDPKVRARNFQEVTLGYTAEQAVEEAGRCLSCKNPKCVEGCPVNVRIPEFIKKVQEGDFKAAYEIITSTNALPALSGRVCPQETQCEARCVRGIKGEPVAIGRLERFVADWYRENVNEMPKPVPSNGVKVAVVGSGPAGMTAAIYAARADMKVLMLDKLAPGGQIINTNEIQNYPGVGTINGAELAYQMFEHTQQFESITFDYGTVKEIQADGAEKKVVCEEDGKEFTAKAIILATGTEHRCLHVPGEDKFKGRGISWCAICDGAQYRDKDVVVIGGGNSAVEESIYLSDMVKSLTIVTMFDLTADPIACDKLRAMDKVTIYPYQDVLEFEGDDKLTGVHFKSTKTGEENHVACDGVFEYIGLIPTTEYLKDTGLLNKFGYIEVDEKMHTHKEGVYAAGDCVTKNLRQVITACADGAIAAQEAAHYVQNLDG